MKAHTPVAAVWSNLPSMHDLVTRNCAFPLSPSSSETFRSYATRSKKSQFRKERSVAYRIAAQRSRDHAKAQRLKAKAGLPNMMPRPSEGTSKMTFAALTPSEMEKRAQPAPDTSGFTSLARKLTGLSQRSGEEKIKIHFRDVNVSFFFPLSQTTLWANDALNYSLWQQWVRC